MENKRQTSQHNTYKKRTKSEDRHYPISRFTLEAKVIKVVCIDKRIDK